MITESGDDTNVVQMKSFTRIMGSTTVLSIYAHIPVAWIVGVTVSSKRYFD